MVATVLANGLNLRLYVEWLLEQMPNAGAFTDEVVDGFLPWSASVPDSCRLEPDKAERARERAMRRRPWRYSSTSSAPVTGPGSTRPSDG